MEASRRRKHGEQMGERRRERNEKMKGWNEREERCIARADGRCGRTPESRCIARSRSSPLYSSLFRATIGQSVDPGDIKLIESGSSILLLAPFFLARLFSWLIDWKIKHLCGCCSLIASYDNQFDNFFEFFVRGKIDADNSMLCAIPGISYSPSSIAFASRLLNCN